MLEVSLRRTRCDSELVEAPLRFAAGSAEAEFLLKKSVNFVFFLVAVLDPALDGLMAIRALGKGLELDALSTLVFV